MMESDNAGVPPCLGLSHANERNTGVALRMWLHPAAERQPGNIALSLARQSSSGGFDWWNSVYVQLGPIDLAKILMVFTGWTESIANDGAGMDNAIRHTLDNGTVVTVDLSHKVDPYPSYCLSLVKRGPGVGAEQVQIELSNAEALAITEAIHGAMPYVAFGVPSLAKEEE